MPRRSKRGASPPSGHVGPMELQHPGDPGRSAARTSIWSTAMARTAIYDIDFVPIPGADEKTATRWASTYLDHLTHNLHRGNMAKWADYYERIFNFREIRYFDIEGKQTGLVSKAMTSPDGKIRIPLNESRDEQEPDRGVPASDYRRGHPAPGAGHPRHLRTPWRRCASRASRFQTTPDTYYEQLGDRVPGNHGEDVRAAAGTTRS